MSTTLARGATGALVASLGDVAGARQPSYVPREQARVPQRERAARGAVAHARGTARSLAPVRPATANTSSRPDRRSAWARARAGYWLATSIVLGALVSFVHFFEGKKAETPSVIMQSYDNLALSIPALIVLFSLIGVLSAMATQAVRVRRVSGRWW